MRQLSFFSVALFALLSGCASQHAAQTSARPAAGDPAVAVQERQFVRPGMQDSFEEQTLLRVRGDDEDFLVVTGPLDAGWASSGRAARGEFQRATESGNGTWFVHQGYVLAWGFWPAVNTPRVAAGADGSALLVVVDVSNFNTVVREFVVFLEGTEATIKSHSGVLLTTMTQVDRWVEVTGTATNPSVTTPATLDTAIAPLQKAIADAKKHRDLLTGW